MKSIQKKYYKIILLVVCVLFFIGAITTAVLYFVHRPYMAVYLATGDVYFGRTSLFPRVVIHNPWFLQRAEDGTLSLESFSNAIWMPQGGMKINRDQIVFMSRLSSASSVIAVIEGRATSQQQIPQQQIPQEGVLQQQLPQEGILPGTIEN